MKRQGNYIMIDVDLIKAVTWMIAGPVFGLSIVLLTAVLN